MDFPRKIMSELYKTRNETWDLTVKVSYDDEEVVYKLHKIILTAASPVFRGMLCGNFKEKNEVILHDISPSNFDKVEVFIYLGETIPISAVEVSSKTEEIFELLHFLHMYHIDSYFNHIVTSINSVLNMTNAAQVYFMSRKYDKLTPELMTNAKRPVVAELKKQIATKNADTALISVFKNYTDDAKLEILDALLTS